MLLPVRVGSPIAGSGCRLDMPAGVVAPDCAVPEIIVSMVTAAPVRDDVRDTRAHRDPRSQQQ